jgi:hypothetical protein
MSRSKLRIAGIILVALCLVVTGAGVSPGTPQAGKGAEALLQPALLLPGGIADPAGQTAYVTNTTGGMDAIDLKTGQTLWDTREATQPLIVSGNRLAALVRLKGKPATVRIVILDVAQKGKKIRECPPLEFPGYRKGWGGGVFARSYLDRGELVVEWTVQWRSLPAQPNEIPEWFSGVARIDLKSGRVQELPRQEKTSVAHPWKLPAELEKELAALTAPSQLYWSEGAWASQPKPLVAGSKVAVLARELVEKGRRVIQEKIVLTTWDLTTGKAHKPVQLLQGAAGMALRTSLEGRHVFLLQTDKKNADPAENYDWWYAFSLETGQRVGKAKREPNSFRIAVTGPRAYFSVHRESKILLQAVELASGKRLWERPIGSDSGFTVLAP